MEVGDEMRWGRFLACWRRRDGKGFGWLRGGVVGMKSGERDGGLRVTSWLAGLKVGLWKNQGSFLLGTDMVRIER